MDLYIIHALLGDHSKTEKELDKELTQESKKERKITPEFIDKLSSENSKELAKELLAECKKLKRINYELKEENEKITDIASLTSVALAELRQGVLDAIDVSESYIK